MFFLFNIIIGKIINELKNDLLFFKDLKSILELTAKPKKHVIEAPQKNENILGYGVENITGYISVEKIIIITKIGKIIVL